MVYRKSWSPRDNKGWGGVDWVLGIGCECCGLRKTAAGCWSFFSVFLRYRGVNRQAPRWCSPPPSRFHIYRPSAASAFLLCYLLDRKAPSSRTHAPLFRTPPPKNRFQSIVEQSFNPGLSSLPNHIRTPFATVVFPRLVPLERSPDGFVSKFLFRTEEQEGRGERVVYEDGALLVTTSHRHRTAHRADEKQGCSRDFHSCPHSIGPPPAHSTLRKSKVSRDLLRARVSLYWGFPTPPLCSWFEKALQRVWRFANYPGRSKCQLCRTAWEMARKMSSGHRWGTSACRLWGLLSATSGGESWNSRSSRKTWESFFFLILLAAYGVVWSYRFAFVRVLTFTSGFLNQKEPTPTTDRAVETWQRRCGLLSF